MMMGAEGRPCRHIHRREGEGGCLARPAGAAGAAGTENSFGALNNLPPPPRR